LGAIKKNRNTDILAPIVLFAILYGLAELFIYAFSIPRWIIPTPTRIFATFFMDFGSIIMPQMITTLSAILIGYVIAVPLGIIVAAFLTQFKILDMAFSPYVIMLVTTPLIALVPLLMIWLGFGINVKIIAVIIQTFPIVMMNSATGFGNVDELKLEFMKALGATRRKTFMKVILPNSLPHVFTGLKLGCIFATITAISAEFVGGNSGLGWKISVSTSYIQTDVAFACILTVALISILFYTAVSMAEKIVVKWKT